MLNDVYRSGELLNPCSYLKSKRTEQYAEPKKGEYGPGSGQVIITLPVDTTLDLSSSNLDFDLSFINATDEVPVVFALEQVGSNVPASGGFFFSYDGDNSGLIPYNATAQFIEDALNNMFPINGRQYTVVAAGGDLPTTVTITVSGFNYTNQKFDDISNLAVVNSSMATGGGAPAFYAIRTTTNSVFSYPRAERFFCPFQKVSIMINNKSVCDIEDFDILYNIIQLSRPTFSIWSDEIVSSAFDEGSGLLRDEERIRMQIDLKSIDLFRRLIPLNIFKGVEVQLRLSMQEATQCLIIKGSDVNNNNPFSQSYRIDNLRLHYYTVDLHENDLIQLQKIYNSEGIAIPFFNWFTDTKAVSSGQTQDNISFSPQASNVLGLFAVFLSNGYSEIGSNQRKRSTFLGDNLESFRVKLGSSYFPSDTTKMSNIYKYSSDLMNEYINFVELFNRTSTHQDLMALQSFDYQIIDPEVRIYSTEQQRLLNVNTIFCVNTCDAGYDSLKNEKCPLNYFQGVDVSNSSSNYFNYTGATIQTAQTFYIYVLTQDSLVFRPGKMEWKH